MAGHPPGDGPHHPRGARPPQGMQAKGRVPGPHTRTPAPTGRVDDGPRQTAQRADSWGRGGVWPQTPLKTDTRAARPRLPAPEEHREYGPRGQLWTPYAHTRAHSMWAAGPDSPQEEGSRKGGERPASDAPRNGAATDRGGGAPSADTHTRMPACGTGVQAPPPTPRRAHSRCTSHGKSAPHPLLLGTATQQWRNPQPGAKTRPRSPTLDTAHEVIRALGLRGGKGDPPQEDAGTESDLKEIPEPSTGSTPAEPAPPAGRVPTLCPTWKQGHCTGEGWCPKQHPQPGPADGALPEVGRAAARAALRYGVAQGWILDETARGSVNIQEAVDRVAHAGQTADPQRGSLWSP